MGNPAIEKRILEWIKSEAEPPGTSGSLPGPRKRPFSEWWAEAVVERYRRVPTEAEWYADPIASEIGRPLADSLHDDVFRLALTYDKKKHQ
jgi:hypothetical protein